MGKVRIIGGKYRSRLLSFPDNVEGLRPTPDRVRETLFNWLNQDLSGKLCLDLFAGSGILGFEAASRNAAGVVLVECNRYVVRQLVASQRLLSVPQVEIVCNDAVAYLSKLSAMELANFTLIFVDAPYAGQLLGVVLKVLLNRRDECNSALLVYIEYNNVPDLSGYTVIKHQQAGQVNYALICFDYGYVV